VVSITRETAKIPQVKGPLLESYSNVQIFEGFPYKLYEVSIDGFTKKQREFVDLLANAIKRVYSIEELRRTLPIEKAKEFAELFNSEIIQTVEVNQLLLMLPSYEVYMELKKSLIKLLEEFFPDLENKEKIVTTVLGEAVGYGLLEPLIRDDNLEEIMVNGPKRPIFVFHKRHGMCRTNIVIENERKLYRIVARIAYTVGKKFDENNALLDARLPDGSRVNATYKSATPFGYTLTIRKFNKTPLSIVQLIQNRTISSEAAAFLWLAVEGLKINPMNIIVSGGASSGKTTLLNALAAFIRYDDRILTIEDTLELDLGKRENWIQLEARPKIQDTKEISMNDLLKNSLRMRPDRIIVGEVRGEEAQTMFVAMDTGHRGMLGTLHSNTAREMVLRLKNAPMNVPIHMIPLLDIAVIMFRMYDRRFGIIRRVREIAEIDRMEDKILLSNVYEWNRKKDVVEKTDIPARTFDKLANATSLTKGEVKEEFLIRRRILEWMLENNIVKWADVEGIIQKYYLDPKSILDKITK